MTQLEIALSHFPLPPFPVILCNDCRCNVALGRTMQYFFDSVNAQETPMKMIQANLHYYNIKLTSIFSLFSRTKN